MQTSADRKISKKWQRAFSALKLSLPIALLSPYFTPQLKAESPEYKAALSKASDDYYLWLMCLKQKAESYSSLDEPAETLATVAISDCSDFQIAQESSLDAMFQAQGFSPNGSQAQIISATKRDSLARAKAETIGYVIRARMKKRPE